MKAEVSRPVMFGVIGLAVLILAVVIYKAMSAPVGLEPTQQQLEQARKNAEDIEKRNMGGSPGEMSPEAKARGMAPGQ